MIGSVWVLCPNGHRVNIEVGPNTPLSLIKQQACDKHGFDPAKFGLKREDHKKTLDLSFPFRLSGLPNKAKLELVEESNKDAIVNIALQLDTGQRILGKCLNSSNIRVAINSICGDIQSASHAMYLQQRIDSSDFDSVKLSDLGISKGSALLKLHNVVYGKSEIRNADLEKVISSDKTVVASQPEAPETIEMEVDDVDMKSENDEINQPKDKVDLESLPVLFHLNSSIQQEGSTAPDSEEDFYEFNDHDLRIMLRDLHKISEREFKFKGPQKEKQIPEKVVIRIRFPNGMMLQNVFKTKVDTTDFLYDFVGKYLTKESFKHLNLFQAPPKQIIKPGLTLVEAGLTNTSLLHAGGEIEMRSDLTADRDSTRALNQLVDVVEVSANRCSKEETVTKLPEVNSSSSPGQSSNSRVQATSKSGKPVPKWFKLN